MTLIIIVVGMFALFALAFVTKRRFGVLGLALAAGVVLSQQVSANGASLLRSWNIPVQPLSYDAVAAAVIILLPSLVLLAGGPTYVSKKLAIVGSIGYALLGTFFVLGPLTTALPTDDPNIRNLLTIIANWQTTIVGLALILAIVDVFLVHGTSKNRHRKRS